MNLHLFFIGIMCLSIHFNIYLMDEKYKMPPYNDLRDKFDTIDDIKKFTHGVDILVDLQNKTLTLKEIEQIIKNNLIREASPVINIPFSFHNKVMYRVIEMNTMEILKAFLSDQPRALEVIKVRYDHLNELIIKDTIKKNKMNTNFNANIETKKNDEKIILSENEPLNISVKKKCFLFSCFGCFE